MKIPIYGGKLKIDFPENFLEYSKKLGYENMENIGAFVTPLDETTGVIRMVFDRDWVKPSVVAHEAVHVMSQVFGVRGIYHDSSNDESVAYFIGWVVDQVYKKFNKL